MYEMKLNYKCEFNGQDNKCDNEITSSKKDKYDVPKLPNGEVDLDAKLPDGTYVHNFSSGAEYFKSKEFKEKSNPLITERQAHYLREFTDMGSKSVNDILEKGKEYTLEPNDFDARMLKNVDNAMRNSVLDKDQTLYMGLDLKRAELYETTIPGELIKFKRFSSTSKKLDQAANFAVGGWGSGIKLVPKTILEIQAPSGIHAINMTPYAEPNSYKEKEQEVLLDRGISFEVVDSYKKDRFNIIKVKVVKGVD